MYFEGVPTPAYGLNKAKANLKESDYGGETIPIMARQGEDQETEASVLQAQLKKAKVEMDQVERQALFKNILTRMNDDLPYTPIGYAPRFFTLRNYVKGFTTDNDDNFRPWDGGLNHTWLNK